MARVSIGSSQAIVLITGMDMRIGHRSMKRSILASILASDENAFAKAAPMVSAVGCDVGKYAD